MNGLMALRILVGLIGRSGIVAKETYFDKVNLCVGEPVPWGTVYGADIGRGGAR
jgi:hypothetical protein